MIFKNINSEDISGLIICSEPPISSSAIRTKETTIDGRDGAIVEKLGYKTRIRNVEIGLKKDANVDKILSYFSGEGDLIFKNENDKVYKAAIYEQVDLERLLRLRKGSVAFYCQPFKYKRNDIFETIKDNKVKEKKGKHLELLNCAEQNVVDLKLEGSTNQATRSGKNLLNVTATSRTYSEGVTITVNKDKSITISGTNTSTKTIFHRLADNFVLPAGDYTLSNKNANASVQGFLFYDDGNNFPKTNISNATFTEDTTISPYIRIVAGVTINNQTIYPMILKGTYTEETIPEYEQYGASPSPDYPAKIENVEGKNKFDINQEKEIFGTMLYKYSYYLKPSTKYTISSNCPASTTTNIYANSTSSNSAVYINKNQTIQSDENGYFYILVRFKADASDNSTFNLYEKILNGTYYIQLEEGTVATPYVPYNSLEIKDIGENLFDINKRLQGTINSEGDLEISRNVNKFYEYDFKENTQYTFSAYVKNENENKGNVRFKIVYKDGTKNGEVLLNRTTIYEYITYTSALNKTIDYIAINYGSEGIMYIKNGELQIEEGTQATPYKPYQEQKVDFPLSEGQKLYEGSYLASDGIHHKRKQIILTGNEDWVLTSTGNQVLTKRFSVRISPPMKMNSQENALCTHFANVNNAAEDIESIYYAALDGITYIALRLNVNKATTLEQFKAYLSGQYSNGTPVTVEYEPATEEIVPYTTAQQEAYNQLQKLKLYKGQNTMFSLEGSIINLKYLEDTDEKVENQGNIYSKPIIRLEKTVFKEVEIAINGIRFKYNFEEDDYVEIDCEEMTVQYEGLDRNRRLVIDFEFPKLKEGNNDIVMYSGDCIIKCKRKDRWL